MAKGPSLGSRRPEYQEGSRGGAEGGDGREWEGSGSKLEKCAKGRGTGRELELEGTEGGWGRAAGWLPAPGTGTQV